MRSDAPIHSEGMGFQVRPLAPVTIPKEDQHGWWPGMLEMLRTPGQLRCDRGTPPAGLRPGGLRRSTRRQVFILPPVPHGAGPGVLERSRIANPRTSGQEMRVHPTHDVTLANEATAKTWSNYVLSASASSHIEDSGCWFPAHCRLSHAMSTC